MPPLFDDPLWISQLFAWAQGVAHAEVHPHRQRALGGRPADLVRTVLQLSMPTHDPARLLDIGRRLKALREERVLVIGSGFMTHGLPYLSRENFARNTVPGWSADFDAWAAETLARGDLESLADFRAQAPGMPYAHPTVEHFTPLFVTLGAAANPEVPAQTITEGTQFGLSKRSFQVA